MFTLHEKYPVMPIILECFCVVRTLSLIWSTFPSSILREFQEPITRTQVLDSRTFAGIDRMRRLGYPASHDVYTPHALRHSFFFELTIDGRVTMAVEQTDICLAMVLDLGEVLDLIFCLFLKPSPVVSQPILKVRKT